MKDIPQKMIDDARELYLKYSGRQAAAITREMHERGWTRFRREYLYTRRNRYCISPGWPERFGWTLEAQTSRRSTSIHEFELWLRTSFREWSWGWSYQRYIYTRLAQVTSGKCRRLMIFMPPRHGKSEMVTVRYTAWRLLREPGLNVILGSYNQKLADKFSRKIKRIVRSADTLVRMSAKHEQKPQSLDTPNLTNPTSSLAASGDADKSVRAPLNTASEWETTSGGVVRSVGVGGGIAGFGAGLIVIDDPVRNRADAESETYRERVWDWFNDDIYTRLEPAAAIILIQTRWHEDDLAGRLLKEAEDGGEKWEVVRLPALAVDAITNDELRITNENKDSKVLNSKFVIRNSKLADPLGRRPGQPLCAKRFNAAALERIKKKIGSYSFAALYQQEPVPITGGSFKREWFRQTVDAAPQHLRWKRGYDLAISTKTSADFTASFRCAFDRQGNLYIADGFRRRIEYPEQRRFIIERMRSEPGTEHGIEAALHGKAVVQDLRREPGMRRYAFREVAVEADKLTRALAWLNLAEAGKVFLVRGPWIDEFVDEVCRFPSGRFDDQVDAVSVAVSMLGKNGGGYKTCFFD